MFLKWLKQFHWPLVYAKIALTAVGIMFIHSATQHTAGSFGEKQMIWAMVGFGLFFIIPWIGSRSFLSVSYLLYVISLILLLWVLATGHVRMGAQRWLSIGPLVIQPSEFAKLSTVLALAHFLGSRHSWEKDRKVILAALAMGLLPFFLIMKQPDLGSALLFLPMVAVLLFLWGIRYRYFIFALISGGMAMPVLWFFLREYQKKRILVFLNPQLDPLGSGYTALQSRIAVGSGGLAGKGYLAGTQSQLNFVPEHHTDFIFCVLGEEWGFLGAALLLTLYGFLFNAIFEIIRHTTDIKARLLGAGVVAMLFSQVFINIGMSIGLMPVAGITLPLVSYGGSSFLATSIALGLLLSVHKERSIF